MTTATRTRSRKKLATKAQSHPHPEAEAQASPLPTTREPEPLERAQVPNEAPEAREATHEGPDAGYPSDPTETDTLPSFRGRN